MPLHEIEFAFSPSLASNDHQVRILVDRKDWLGDSVLGIDPPEFFSQPALTTGGELLVGRCECGCVGCDDVTVQVVRQQDEVKWIESNASEMQFSVPLYYSAVNRAKNDNGWETPGRTAERLVANELAGLLLANGFSFQWASTRIRAGILSLSFLRDGMQRLVDLTWDGVRPETAHTSAMSWLTQLGEQSHAPEPAAGPASDGESSPPAQ